MEVVYLYTNVTIVGIEHGILYVYPVELITAIIALIFCGITIIKVLEVTKE